VFKLKFLINLYSSVIHHLPVCSPFETCVETSHVYGDQTHYSSYRSSGHTLLDPSSCGIFLKLRKSCHSPRQTTTY
jgi:hypothetical protein